MEIQDEDHVFKPDILTNDYQADMNSEPCEMLFVYETRDWNVERVLANKSLNQIASPNFQIQDRDREIQTPVESLLVSRNRFSEEPTSEPSSSISG